MPFYAGSNVLTQPNYTAFFFWSISIFLSEYAPRQSNKYFLTFCLKMLLDRVISQLKLAISWATLYIKTAYRGKAGMNDELFKRRMNNLDLI